MSNFLEVNENEVQRLSKHVLEYKGRPASAKEIEDAMGELDRLTEEAAEVIRTMGANIAIAALERLGCLRETRYWDGNG